MMDDKRPKVLIVDDVTENIQILNSILQETYLTIFATDGEKAIKIAREQNPDLILLDVGMPGIDGYEVCRRMQSEPLTHNTPVIFITSFDDIDDEARGFDSGGVDYITKPVNPLIVRARVRTHIKLKQQADTLRALSSLDGLTGLANRRQFDESLATNWSRCSRSESPLSLVLLDVDYFKQFNDTYGHQAGDDCLREVARVLSSHVQRTDDLAARYGGEEFVCLLPHTPLEGGLEIARSILETIQALRIPHKKSEISNVVTASAGVATTIEFEPGKAEILTERSDRALYAAKKNGRNQVCQWEQVYT